MGPNQALAQQRWVMPLPKQSKGSILEKPQSWIPIGMMENVYFLSSSTRPGLGKRSQGRWEAKSLSS